MAQSTLHPSSSPYADHRLALFLWIAFVASFALGSVGRQLIWLLGLYGLWQVVRRFPQLRKIALFRRYGYLLALMVLPGALAQLDAFDPARSGRTLFRMMWYALAAVPLFFHPLPIRQQRGFLLGCGAALVLLLLDGLLQRYLGVNIIGQPSFDDGRYALRITGFLGVDYGWVMACLSPFVLFAAQAIDARGRLLWLVIPLLCSVLYFSGSRASMLLLLAGFAGFVIYLPAAQEPFAQGASRLRFLGVVVSASAACGLALFLADSQRWADALQVFSANAHDVSQALSLRPVIWSKALSVASEYWVNGVGLRGFTPMAAPELAATPGLPPKTVGWAPHLAILEVATSTGFIGVLSYLLCLATLCFWLRCVGLASRAAGLAGLLALFPLGSTLPLYSARVAGTAWMMIAIAFALEHARRQTDREVEACAA